MRRATLAPTVVSQVGRDCPAVAWPDRAMLVLREVICGWAPCRRVFWLCSGCDRGQHYCSGECRDEARASNQRRARRKYARSEPGRKNNRERQRRSRARQASRNRNGSVFTGGAKCGELSTCTSPATSCTSSATSPRDATEGRGDVTPMCVEAKCGQLPCTAGSGQRGHRSTPVASTWSPAVARHGETRRCHVCGRIGKVARRGAARGRFRWAGDVNGWQ